MREKHEPMWLGKSDYINITEQAIALIPCLWPFKYPSYQEGTKTRELEQFEVEKQIKSGVIEPFHS